jgi:hypothetical protein
MSSITALPRASVCPWRISERVTAIVSQNGNAYDEGLACQRPLSPNNGEKTQACATKMSESARFSPEMPISAGFLASQFN